MAFVTTPVALHRRRGPTTCAALVGENDPWSTWAAVTAAATVGMGAETTAIGKVLTSPVCAMLSSAFMVNVGVLPARNEALGAMQRSVATLSTPLLLLDADLRNVLRSAGRGMLLSFAVAASSVCVGGVSMFAILRALGFALDWQLCCALIAKNVGGGLNYIAVCATLGLPPDVIAAGLTVDNVVGLLYFPGISLLSELYTGSAPASATQESDKSSAAGGAQAVGAEGLITSVSFASAIVAVAMKVASFTGSQATLPIATAIAVALATLFPRRIDRFRNAGKAMGQVLLFIYFASAGAGGGAIGAVASRLTLLLFCAGMYIIHVAALQVAITALRLPPRDAFLSSNASIGGPATASAMAIAKGWTEQLVPSILVGNLGNAIATFVALFLGRSIMSHM